MARTRKNMYNVEESLNQNTRGSFIGKIKYEGKRKISKGKKWKLAKKSHPFWNDKSKEKYMKKTDIFS